MKTFQKVAIIGGTGRAGAALVNELLDRGYALRLLLRHPEKYTKVHPMLELVKGDATDSLAIQALLGGCSAVMSTLGQRPGERPPFSQTTSLVLQAMPATGISRYVLVTGLSIEVPNDRKGFRTRLLSWVMRKWFPGTIADKQKEYEALAVHSAEWTLLRLPRIRVTDTQNTIRVNLHDCPGKEIGTADLARFLVDELENKRYVRLAPFVAGK